MTAEAAVARVGEIQAMIGALRGQGPSTGGATPPSTSFATALQSATAATAAPTATAASAGGDSSPYDGLITESAQRNGVDPALLKGLIRQESNFDPAARSGAGAVGLTQLMPATAAGLGVADPTDPAQAIEGGARYLRAQLDRFGGDEAKALAAYNAGPGAVQRYGGVPPYAETQAYVQRVLGYARAYRGTLLSTPTPIGS
jgi:soluble lytic murein transglycosylase-like protein